MGHRNPKWIFCIVNIYICMAFESLKFGRSSRVIWQKRIDLVLATYQPGKSDAMLMVILLKYNAVYKYSVYIYIYHVCICIYVQICTEF